MIEGLLQPTHLLVILAVAIFVLGPKKIPELGKSLAQGIRSPIWTMTMRKPIWMSSPGAMCGYLSPMPDAAWPRPHKTISLSHSSPRKS